MYATEYIPPANVYAIEMIALAQTQSTTLSVKNQYVTFVHFEIQPLIGIMYIRDNYSDLVVTFHVKNDS